MVRIISYLIYIKILKKEKSKIISNFIVPLKIINYLTHNNLNLNSKILKKGKLKIILDVIISSKIIREVVLHENLDII